MESKNRGLGKGLSALISSGVIADPQGAYHDQFDITKIDPNPYQPRMEIKPEELVGIARSIKVHGIIQPIIVTRNRDNPDRFYIIAGERRFRAAQLANLESVPVLIKESSPQDMLEMALIENLQRRDLNALEEAQAFKQLCEEFGMKHREVGERVGMTRVAVTNKLRLLTLPDQIQAWIMNSELTEGHARALLGITDRASLVAAASVVLKRHMTVRETEELVRKVNFGKTSSNRSAIQFRELTAMYADPLARKLGYGVKFTQMANGGKLVIRFMNLSDLEDLGKKLGIEIKK